MLRQYRNLLKNRDYTRLWFGQTTSVFGDAVYQLAFNWLVFKNAPSPFIAGLAISIASAPYLLFGLIGGVYADRLNRRYVMIAGDVVRAATVAIVPFLCFVSKPPLLVVTGVACVLASVRCFFYPASKVLAADILANECDRQAGSAFLQASFQVASVAGLAFGGVMISLCSAPLMYLMPVASYVISALLLMQIKNPSVSRVVAERGLFGEIIVTTKIVWKMRELFWTILLFGLGVLAIDGIEQVALPALSDSTWHVGAGGLGLVLGALAIGSVIGSLVIGTLKVNRISTMIFVGWALWGLFYVLLGLSSNYAMALSFAVMAGSAEAVNDVPVVLLIQSSVPRESMGKVFSFWSTIVFVAEAGAALLGGFAVERLGAATACCASGLVLAMLAMIGLFLTRARSSTSDARIYIAKAAAA